MTQYDSACSAKKKMDSKRENTDESNKYKMFKENKEIFGESVIVSCPVRNPETYSVHKKV